MCILCLLCSQGQGGSSAVGGRSTSAVSGLPDAAFGLPDAVSGLTDAVSGLPDAAFGLPDGMQQDPSATATVQV